MMVLQDDSNKLSNWAEPGSFPRFPKAGSESLKLLRWISSWCVLTPKAGGRGSSGSSLGCSW